MTAEELIYLQSEEVRDWDLSNLINLWTRGASKEKLDFFAFNNAITGGRSSDRIQVYTPAKAMRQTEKVSGYNQGSPLRGGSSTKY